MEKKRKREGEGEVPQKKRGRPKKSDSPLSARYPDIHGEALDPVAENRNTDAVAKATAEKRYHTATDEVTVLIQAAIHS